MKTTEILRTIMTDQGIGVSKIASRLGKSSRLVCERISQTNISIEKLNEMLRVLDYKIVVMPRETTTPRGGFEIE